jgi:hypothetical protein
VHVGDELGEHDRRAHEVERAPGLELEKVQKVGDGAQEDAAADADRLGELALLVLFGLVCCFLWGWWNFVGFCWLLVLREGAVCRLDSAARCCALAP